MPKKGRCMMEKQIATVGGVIGSIVSYMVDGIGMAVSVLILLMAIDYVTGLMVAMVTRSLNSRVGFLGIVRKLYYLLLVGAVYGISLVIPQLEYTGDGVAIAICVLEIISVTENGSRLGLPIPKYVQNLLLVVKDRSDNEGDKK